MDEANIRRMIGEVKRGRLSRRDFIRTLGAAGLAAPLASQVLMHAGVAHAQPAFAYAPTKRGGGGHLKVLWWQGPTLLNPHFATGTKDQDGSRIFYEPLASWDSDGNLIPTLAAQLPSREDGTLSQDGRSVIWKLKPGVTWHDGKPFTADDVVFNWAYARDPATAAVTNGIYKDIVTEKIDDLTVRVTFQNPTPFWANAFVGVTGQIIPKHLFAEYSGSKSRDAPTNLKPVGTGPYKFVEFRPGDLVRGEINSAYHMALRPHFDSIELKGGGDASSAARSVLQTGEFDFAWNLQVEDEILTKMEQGGKGRVILVPAGSAEFISLNFTDPNVEVDGERSSLKTQHPAFRDKAVRQALNMLVDRTSVERHIYGRSGAATANFINRPDRFRSTNTSFEFDVGKANDLLDKSGWARGADGIRAKGGTQLKWMFQTSTNGPRQKTQAIVKQACQKAGIDIEIKSVVASVFFSSDVANPDTYAKFYSDIEMFSNGPTHPDPEAYLQTFRSDFKATKENKWQGRNFLRYSNPEYDATHKAAESELDPVKRAALLIKCNDIVIADVAVIPIVARLGTHAAAQKLRLQPGGWDSSLWALHSWHREG